MRVTLFIVLLIFGFSLFAENKTDTYQQRVTKSLKKNPDNIELIYQAGTHYYKKKDYRKAIWYWSSPKLIRHKRYPYIKYYQALAHTALNEKSTAIYVLNLVDQTKVSANLKRKIKSLQDKLVKPKIIPVSPKTFQQLSLFGAMINYNTEAIKDNATDFGAYYLYNRGRSTFEILAERLKIGFNQNLLIDDYEQTNAAVGYSFFNTPYTYKHRFLAHTNTTESNQAIKGTALLYGLSYFFKLGQSVGADISYIQFSESANTPSFAAQQVSPRTTLKLTDSIYLRLQAHYLTHGYTSSTSTDNSKNSLSAETTISYYSKSFNVDLNLGAGEERFLLKSDGFMIQNTTETFLNTQSLSITLNLSRSFTLSGKYQINQYSEENNQNKQRAQNALLTGNFYF